MRSCLGKKKRQKPPRIRWGALDLAKGMISTRAGIVNAIYIYCDYSISESANELFAGFWCSPLARSMGETRKRRRVGRAWLARQWRTSQCPMGRVHAALTPGHPCHTHVVTATTTVASGKSKTTCRTWRRSSAHLSRLISHTRYIVQHQEQHDD